MTEIKTDTRHHIVQAAYTGRCLGGVLTPNKAVPTDQREFTKGMLDFVAAVAGMSKKQRE